MHFRLISSTCILLALGTVACTPAMEEERLPIERAELPMLSDIPDGYYAMDTDTDLPLETFLVDGSRLNARVQDRNAFFRFASNREDAAFECSVGETTDFRTCSGASLNLPNLEHGRSYRIQVRAVLPSGRRDATPLTIEIVSDRVNGGPLYLPKPPPEIPGRQIGSVADLPWVPVNPGPDAPPGDDHQLLLGEEDLVIPPRGMIVASFSAVKSLALNLLTFRLVDDSQAGCQWSWERIVQHPLGPWYCEGFPTDDELAALDPPMARNHVSLERRDGPFVRESLYAATLTAPGDDRVRAELTTEALCAQAKNAGTSAAGPRFVSRRGTAGSMTWCLVQRPTGSWWIARWDDDRSRSDGSRLLAVYAAHASAGGFLTPDLFLRRARQYMTTTIIPSGQTQY